MLDISFSELVVCLLVALIVLGPERLPVAARAVGRWTGKARAYMRNFTAELEREAQLSEIRKQLDETQRLLQQQSQVLQQSSQKILNDARSLAHHDTAPLVAEPPGTSSVFGQPVAEPPPASHEPVALQGAHGGAHEIVDHRVGNHQVGDHPPDQPAPAAPPPSNPHQS